MLSAHASVKAERPRAVPGFEAIACSWDVSLKQWCAKILPGEFYITRSNVAITTVLGSCISACIRDPSAGLGGMNHFMLPEETHGKSTWLDQDAGLATRYGSFAMECLINGLLKLGARRERLEVKLFGGGHILNAEMNVGDRNIEFARRWVKAEGYGVAAEDVGLNVPRRVVYFPESGKVRVKYLRAPECHDIALREQSYLQKAVDKVAIGEIELFGGGS
jgi:chemotaxis protein CheD